MQHIQSISKTKEMQHPRAAASMLEKTAFFDFAVQVTNQMVAFVGILSNAKASA